MALAGETCDFSSMVDLLRHRAAVQVHDRAFVFVSDKGGEEAELTFAELHRQACVTAGELAKRATRGERVLLSFPPGLDFIAAFFGCLMAGMIAVPMMPPRRTSARDSSAAIVADCAPRLALTTNALLSGRAEIVERFRYADMAWIAVDSLLRDASAASAPEHMPTRSDIAFLQYTSGSTSAPKGVMVSHGNLLSNLEMIRIAFDNTRASTCAAWIPFYHDMGLIMNVLESLYVGALCVVLSPTAFLQRPLSWLRIISNYRAEIACAPNFAYDLCVARLRPDQMQDIDLSCWKKAECGAEPIRAATLEQFAEKFAPYGFDAKSMYPGYGMAESTLMISVGPLGRGIVKRRVSRQALQRNMIAQPLSESDTQVLVGNGICIANEEIAIVDPVTLMRLGADGIGEIWVRGPHVALGYWSNPSATAATFQARILGEGGESWLRTGDLGFLDRSGELYITGRIKDLIIIYGTNHYPQDIEITMQAAHPALRKDCGAAFSVVDARGEEKLVLVQEVERTQRNQISIDEVEARIREAISNEHDVAVHRIALIRPGSLPKTTSGKVQRGLTRQLWQDNALELISPADTARV